MRARHPPFRTLKKAAAHSLFSDDDEPFEL
jgi:hypothetical protein